MKNNLKIPLQIYLIITFVALFIIYYPVFLPGIRVAQDFPYASESYMYSLFSLPSIWSSIAGGFGQNVNPTLWSWPYQLLFGMGRELGGDSSVLNKLLGVIPTLGLGFVGIWKLGSYYKLSNWGKVISVVFYLGNSYILLLIDGGQFLLALAYSILPLSFLFVEQAIVGSYKRKIIAVIPLLVMSFFDIRGVYLLLVLLFCRFLFGLKDNKGAIIKWIVSWLQILGTFAFLWILMNFYWIWALLNSFNFHGSLATQVITGVSSSTNFINLSHAMALQQPHWYKNIFGVVSALQFEFVFIPILVFLTALVRRKEKTVAFWMIVAVLGIFLTKGLNPPLGEAYAFLYKYVPGFFLFRDASKFYFLVALSYSILLGLLVSYLEERKLKFTIAFVLVFLIFLDRPVFLGKMTGIFSKPYLEDQYAKQSLFFVDKTSEYFKIAWVSQKPSLGHMDINHPAVNTIDLAKIRPFQVGIKGDYELNNFMREASFSGEIFDVSGIKYISYPPLNPNRDVIKPDNIIYYNLFLSQLKSLPWIKGDIKDLTIPTLETRKSEDLFFVAPNIWWVIGSDDIYNQTLRGENFRLAKNAMIFAEEHLGISNLLQGISNIRIVLNKKGLVDLAASFINSNNMIFPANSLSNEPGANGWWKRQTGEFIQWKNFLKTKYEINYQDFDYGGGWAVAEGEKDLKLSDKRIKKGNVLLARVLESTRSGEISFYQGGTTIATLSTAKRENGFSWFEVGKLSDSNSVDIKTKGPINVINALASVDSNEWELLKKQSNALSEKGKIKQFGENLTSDLARVSYKKISETRYSIKIDDLKKSQLLVFGQSYDPGWKLNSASPIPVYSFLSGFYIDHNGQYTLEYAPQRDVNYGLVVSTIGFVMLILFWKFKK